MTSKPAPHSCPLSPRLPPVARAQAASTDGAKDGPDASPLHKFTGSNVQGRTVHLSTLIYRRRAVGSHQPTGRGNVFPHLLSRKVEAKSKIKVPDAVPSMTDIPAHHNQPPRASKTSISSGFAYRDSIDALSLVQSAHQLLNSASLQRASQDPQISRPSRLGCLLEPPSFQRLRCREGCTGNFCLEQACLSCLFHVASCLVFSPSGPDLNHPYKTL
ncbi:uncharacterized protein CLUP02_00278 [Colletotrichum lupini]|uniref:Uncharacterized protein n=1 Tax=Colletotrichum lupini TaxID=145971 RepID=A0A9Q8SAR6_9PEZI|nr:uncharacterized protein CLUP02_00278 [Colletotrichum lupini]UQC73633.1 hypothetical protein CLUP02_00278 [Colletotrichum lupini]